MDRQQRRARGHAVREDLGLAGQITEGGLPGFNDFIAEVTFAGIWDRPGLSRQERFLCTLAVLSLHQRPQLEAMIASALDHGVAPREVLEVFIQAGLYGGFVTTETSIAVARSVFSAQGVVVPDEPPRDDTDERLDELGQEVMHALHGARATGGYAAPDNPVTGALYGGAIRYGYGELWGRPGLTHQQRMLVAIASFTALKLESQVAKFGQSALNIGLSKEQVIEAVVQTAPYSGFPPALNALGILSSTWETSART